MPEMMECRSCGAQNSVKREACYQCGTVLRPPPPAADPLANEPPSANPPGAPPGYYARGIPAARYTLTDAIKLGFGGAIGWILGGCLVFVGIPFFLFVLSLAGCLAALSAPPGHH